MDFFKKFKKKSHSSEPSSKTSQPQQQQPAGPKLHEPNPNAAKPRGILKNKDDAQKFSHTDAYPTSDDIDESLRNAQKNSSLNQSIGNSLSGSPHKEEMKAAEPNTNNKPPDSSSASSAAASKTANSEEESAKKKGLKWDEANLDQNEKEKVPRMKIDEPPTPYAEMPEELRMESDGDEHEAVEEVILDENPMEMSLDDKHTPDLESSEPASQPPQAKQTLDQQQQSLLLADEEYREKMIKDALDRREDIHEAAQPQQQNQRKIVRSAWEEEDGDHTPEVDGADGGGSAYGMDEQEQRKEAFRKKRKNHYNEFHAIKAWKAKEQQDEVD